MLPLYKSSSSRILAGYDRSTPLPYAKIPLLLLEYCGKLRLNMPGLSFSGQNSRGAIEVASLEQNCSQIWSLNGSPSSWCVEAASRLNIWRIKQRQRSSICKPNGCVRRSQWCNALAAQVEKRPRPKGSEDNFTISKSQQQIRL